MTEQSPNDQFHASSFLQGAEYGMPRFGFRLRIFCALVAGLAGWPAGSAQAAAVDPALQTAIETCLALPLEKSKVAATLKSSGWRTATEGSSVPVDAMFAGHFATHYVSSSAKDVGYAFVNGWFMAGSILGNSALTQSAQVAMTNGDLALLVNGVGEKATYCVLVGSETLGTVVEEWPGIALEPDQRVAPETARKVLTAKTGSATVTLAILDMPKLNDQLDSVWPPVAPAEIPLSEAEFSKLRAAIRPVTVYFAPDQQ